MRYPSYIEAPFDFPPFFHVQMNYPKDQLNDLEATLVPQLNK